MTEKESLRPQTGRRLLRGGLPPEGGIEGVEIAGVEVILNHAEGFAKAYKMEITSLQMRHSILMESLVA